MVPLRNNSKQLSHSRSVFMLSGKCREYVRGPRRVMESLSITDSVPKLATFCYFLPFVAGER